MKVNSIYRRWTQERRERMSKLALERSGAKPGHRIVHGEQVPIDLAPKIRGMADHYRYYKGASAEQTKAFIKHLMETTDAKEAKADRCDGMVSQGDAGREAAAHSAAPIKAQASLSGRQDP